MGTIAPAAQVAAPTIGGRTGALPLGRAWPAIGLLALAGAAAAIWLAFPTYPSYDSQYALLWGHELVHGHAPGFDDYRAPTEHPLLLGVSALLAPLGADAAGRALVALCFGGLIALIAAMYRLGLRVAGPVGALVATGLVASRLNFGLLAAIGYVDVPYCALIAWAAALEMERPRRGGVVWVLLVLAGLLRPEAWLITAVYAVWMAHGRRTTAWIRAIGVASIAPLVWCATDLAFTGDPLFSVHHTDALALELERDRPLVELPVVFITLLVEAVKPPVLVLGLAGAALAWKVRREVLPLPIALVALASASYLVIASGGLATVFRYLLVAALGLMVLASYALAGWTQLPAGAAVRRAWAFAAVVGLLAGGVWTAVHLHPSDAVSQLRERKAQRDDLSAVLAAPATQRARRCGPVSVPNHKLIPQVRAILGLPSGAVIARTDGSRPAQTRGVAIVVERWFERRPSVNVWEITSDSLGANQPAGFYQLATSYRFTAWGSCR